jgi:hypothetical protein
MPIDETTEVRLTSSVVLNTAQSSPLSMRTR